MATTGRGEYRSIYDVLPETREFQQLSKDARLLLYTLKLELGALGIAVAYDEPLQVKSGLNAVELDEARDELGRTGWLERDGRVHWLRNGLKFEPSLSLENQKHVTYIQKELRGLPSCAIANAFADYYGLDAPFPECGDRYTRYPIPEPGNGSTAVENFSGNNTPKTPLRQETPKTTTAVGSSLRSSPTGADAPDDHDRTGEEDAWSDPKRAPPQAIAARYLPLIREHLHVAEFPRDWSEDREVSVLRQMLAKGYDPDEIELAILGAAWLRDHGAIEHIAEKGQTLTMRALYDPKGKRARGTGELWKQAVHMARKHDLAVVAA